MLAVASSLEISAASKSLNTLFSNCGKCRVRLTTYSVRRGQSLYASPPMIFRTYYSSSTRPVISRVSLSLDSMSEHSFIISDSRASPNALSSLDDTINTVFNILQYLFWYLHMSRIVTKHELVLISHATRTRVSLDHSCIIFASKPVWKSLLDKNELI